MPALEDCWFAIFNNKELKFYIRSSSAGNWISLAWGIRVYLRPARRKFGPAAGLFAEEFATVPSSWLTGKGTKGYDEDEEKELPPPLKTPGAGWFDGHRRCPSDNALRLLAFHLPT